MLFKSHQSVTVYITMLLYHFGKYLKSYGFIWKLLSKLVFNSIQNPIQIDFEWNVWFLCATFEYIVMSVIVVWSAISADDCNWNMNGIRMAYKL